MLGFMKYIPVVKELAEIWAMLAAGGLAGLACIAGAIFLPTLRQLFVGLTIACFAATWMLAVGVKQERDVWKAREVIAEQLRKERDDLQSKLAATEAARTAAGLTELNRREEESDDAYAKRIAQLGPVGACRLGDDDLR